MRIYTVAKSFFCAPIKRNLPVGAVIGRCENIVRATITESPRSDLDRHNTLIFDVAYGRPEDVTWVYVMEPPPYGPNSNGFLTLVEILPEDVYGNVVTGVGSVTVGADTVTPAGGQLELIEGTNITLTADVDNNSVTVTAAAGGGGTVQGTTGVLGLQLTDEGVAAGDARGANSTDLQSVRDDADQVASGAGAVVSGGASNRAAGAFSVVAGSENNAADAEYGVVGGGDSNLNTGELSVICGGGSNITDGDGSAILGGSLNDTNGHANVFLIGSSLLANADDRVFLQNISIMGIASGHGVQPPGLPLNGVWADTNDVSGFPTLRINVPIPP